MAEGIVRPVKVLLQEPSDKATLILLLEVLHFVKVLVPELSLTIPILKDEIKQ